MSHEMYLRQTEFVAQREQIVDVKGEAIAMRRLLTQAAPTQVRRDHVPALLSEVRPKAGPELAAGCETMHQQHGTLRLGELSPGAVVQGDAVDAQVVRLHGDVFVHLLSSSKCTSSS